MVGAGMKPTLRAVYYSVMFTWGSCVKERLIYQPLHLEFNVLCLKILILNFRE